MKNLLLILLFTSGFAANQLAAQSSCNPCPPDCCKIACASTADGAAAEKVCLPVCTPEEMKACSAKQTKASRKAATRQGAKAVFASSANAPVDEPAGNEKTACCSKQAAVKEEL